DLRDRSEEKSAHCRKTKHGRRDRGNEPRSHEPRQLTLTRHDRETTIRRLAESPREGNALCLVRVEYGGGVGLTLDHRRKLPREIDRVANTGIHPLAADRTVDVGGVTE